MSVLINHHHLIDDDWIRLQPGDEPLHRPKIIVDLSRLQQQWAFLKSLDCELGVELDSSDDVEVLLDFIDDLRLIVLNFSSFSDGQGFSQARLLRHRMFFKGLLRAQGEVLRDQLSFMQQCGFNQFQLANGEEAQLGLNAFAEITPSYQPLVSESKRFGSSSPLLKCSNQ